MKKALLFLNGEFTGKLDLSGYDIIAAANGGTRLADQLGAFPRIVIGDQDSLPQQLREKFSEAEFIPYPADKDMTDGELGVRYLLDCGYKDLDIAGSTGGRLDQMISNIMVCGKYLDRGRFRLLTGNETAYFMGGNLKSLCLQMEPGQPFSLVPLEKTQISMLSGAEYSLRDRTVNPGDSLTISNCAEKGDVSVTIESGSILFVIMGGNDK